MGISISEVISDEGVSTSLFVKKGDSFTYSIDLSNDFDGSCYFRSTSDGGNSYQRTAVSADIASTLVTNVPSDLTYDIVVEYADGESSLTGTATITLAEVVVPLKEILDDRGNVLASFREDGAYFPYGAKVLSETLGVKNGSTVSIVEKSGGPIHQTVLTLSSTPIEIVSVTTGNGVGGTKIYTLPEGYVRVIGCVASLSIAVETEADFTDATPEGDIGIGSLAPANADSFGSDATDDNYGTGKAFTMDAYAATATIAPEAAINVDGTTTAGPVFVNALIDAADIDNDVTTNLLVSGTVTLTWVNLGDY